MSLPCVLFLFMQLQSRYIRKNYLLSRSCYLFSFLLSFFLSFFFSSFFLSFWISFFPFFTVWSLCRQICLGVDLLDLLSIFTKCTFEVSLKCLTLGQEVFRILKHDKSLNLSRCTHLLCQLTICNDSKFESYILVLVSILLNLHPYLGK